MKTIKFRSWDKKNKLMIIFDRPNYPMNTMALSFMSDHFSKTGKPVGKLSELMQYTGLKDKKGKEIYEGDILADSHKNPCIGEVRWKGYKWDCGTDEDIDNDETPIITETGAIEIIGNIYENPELI